ncbi:hypothetical protein EK21DRAFT_119335 [Setomelanomma holmii]|uniref:Uncharacterized protein n=1 Tax=Setomelanomma holmii TaxID=210430 RepID=A0A9P4LG36_9PLEO|nr:hypothetical protein EK21DRAFT_119335 [Setomelanomma holmii]
MATTHHSEAVSTRGHGHDDQFSIKYFDQGCQLASNGLSPAAPNTACPFHGTILDPGTLGAPPRQNQSTSATLYDLLAHMPPAAFTQNIRMGTSVSCGCTCTQAIAQNPGAFFCDIDAIVLNRR